MGFSQHISTIKDRKFGCKRCSAQLRCFYYDTVGSSNPIQMTALKQLMFTSQIVFGTDFLFGSSSTTGCSLADLRLHRSETSIDRENALRFLSQKCA
jgi:hypothetical protein